MRLLFIVLMLVVGVSAVEVQATTTSTSPGPVIGVNCQPGEYAVNSSGTFICIPVIEEVKVPFATVYVVFNSSSTLYITVSCFDPNGVTGTLTVMDTAFNTIGSVTVDLQQGQYQTYKVALPSGYQEDYVVITGVLNGYGIGTYAIHRQEEAIFAPSSIPDARVGFIITLATVAPLLGVALRGRPKEAGMGLISLGILLVPLFHAMGLTSPIPEFLGGFSAIFGLVLLALNQTG